MRKKTLKPIRAVIAHQDLSDKTPGYDYRGVFHNPYKNVRRQAKKNWNSVPRPLREKAKNLLWEAAINGVRLAPGA
jgi:hypothetical protein